MSEDSNRALLIDRPHRRYNPLTGEWIFVSPHRTRRPWRGREESSPEGALPAPSHDPECYLCPGNPRANGEHNPTYCSTYVFTNDYPAFLPDNPALDTSLSPLLRAHTQRGDCRVICYSPRHDLTLAQMHLAQIREVIDTWAAQVEELEARWRWVQVFENKGELMGCSNPHPHGQIWASDFIPNEVAKELAQQRDWFQRHGSSLLLDYAEQELDAQERLVLKNNHWMVVVPWWAAWPYETLLLPRRNVSRLPDLSPTERDALASILSELLAAYDRLFDVSFPYSFGWHGDHASTLASPAPRCQVGQLHAHFYPPLLRSAAIPKFMVGYELLAEIQRDITPEQAAIQLRSQLARGQSA
jgi:UDPglucose--hexose-1-phosphate uridylyltransferase